MIKNFLDDIYLIENMSSKEFIELKQDYKLLTPSEIFDYDLYQKIRRNGIKDLLCSIGIIDVNHIKENAEDKIIGLYDKKYKTNILFKKEKRYDKKFKTLDDLVSNPNFAMYLNEDESFIEITLYDIKKVEILFFGKINNIDEDEDFIRPYNCSFIENVASIRDIDAKSTVYPILGYYANNNILISDRNILSHKAKSVWYQYFDNSNIFTKYAPIDDKITSDQDYQNILYHQINKNQKIEFLNKHDFFDVKNTNKINRIFNKIINNKSSCFRQRLLISLKRNHYLDWSYKLNSDFINQIEDKIMILKNRHHPNKKLEKRLFNSSNTFFHTSIFT